MAKSDVATKKTDEFKPLRMMSAEGSGDRNHRYEDLDPPMRQVILDIFNNSEDRFFNQYLGFKLVDVKSGYAKLEVENVQHLCQPAMVMHGGASFGLADAAVAMALWGMYGSEKMLLTIEMKINYLEPIPLTKVTAEAFILRASRTSAYAEVDIWADGKLAARAGTTYMIRPMKLDPGDSYAEWMNPKPEPAKSTPTP
jgi:acyl-CoA thioesterase